MVQLTLPDGKIKSFDAAVTGTTVAQSIGASLAKAALAIKVNGVIQDLALPIEADAKIEIITPQSADGLAILRHDCAHVMAEAVQKLFPDAQVTIGPSIENGFYYDFYRQTPFTPDDFKAIEAEMQRIIERNAPFTRIVKSRQEAIEFFKARNEPFKVELINDLPAGEVITFYDQGGFIDLCRGPHSPSTGRVGKAFKVMKVAGAYWRGDSTKPMLQRLYGTAFARPEELEQYLHMLEEAEKRDHRRIGKELKLFHLQEEAAGMVFWHPKGWALYRALEEYIRRRVTKENYVEVKTPMLYESALFKASGHWDHYAENMYKFVDDEDEKRTWFLKPMNCPAHVQIFNRETRSYRDLPLRMAEFGSCHRKEPSGALSGIMRVRNFVQDDAHIFCREDQIVSESLDFIRLQISVYQDLGFDAKTWQVKLALRPDNRAGRDELWDKAEEGLRQAMRAANLTWQELPGEGAFYGPKIEFHLVDAIGRTWQCGTLQLDFVLPERLDANYIGEDGSKHHPVMLHRAMLGSIERFIGVYIEHCAGKFPMWLSPVQCVVASVVSDANDYASAIALKLRAAGLRTESDVRNEKIGYKVREHIVAKVPVVMVVGKRDMEAQQVVLRYLGSDEQLTMSLDDALARLKAEAMPPDLRCHAAATT